VKTQRILITLTVANLGLLSFNLVERARPAFAQVAVAPVLRGRALEIVDERGKVRASISVIPEDPKVIWKGKPYPEIVLLRLITADGRPSVKLGATKVGAVLVTGGESDPTYVQVAAEHGETAITMKNKDGHERVIKPD
jgi:hypothetical protein